MSQLKETGSQSKPADSLCFTEYVSVQIGQSVLPRTTNELRNASVRPDTDRAGHHAFEAADAQLSGSFSTQLCARIVA